MFELKQARFLERLLLSQGKKRRAPKLPPHLKNPPQVWPWLTIFWRAFRDLQTERRWPEGPIPWSVCEDWARKYSLDAEATEMLHIHVQALDLAYREWIGHNKGSNSGADDDRHGRTVTEHAPPSRSRAERRAAP